MLKIVLITQEDSFTIPNNIELLCRSHKLKLVSIFVINSKGSFKNKKYLFLRGFGFFQCIKLFIIKLKYKLFHNSILNIAKKYNIIYKFITNPNSSDVIASIRHLNPDLIVSFSAPVIFESKLLSIPRYGCINLHCSLLPRYAGIFPSFWTLYYKSSTFGVSVHFMDSKIDNGDVIAQEIIKINKETTIFHLIQKTKTVGGLLVLNVLEDLESNKRVDVLDLMKPDFHFTWPTINQIKDFRKKGGRLI